MRDEANPRYESELLYMAPSFRKYAIDANKYHAFDHQNRQPGSQQ